MADDYICEFFIIVKYGSRETATLLPMQRLYVLINFF